jgi:hypothetical protein
VLPWRQSSIAVPKGAEHEQDTRRTTVIAVVVAYWPRWRPAEAFGWPNATARTSHPGGHRRHHRADPLRWSHHPAGPDDDGPRLLPPAGSRSRIRSRQGRAGLTDRASVAQGGHRRPQRAAGWADRPWAAGYWSFFSDDTAGMLRSVRVTAGTGFADFRDFRRLVPDATSYGSAALLAESDGTLRQFRTIKCTLYAFNGDVPAFYAWLRLGPPWMPAGTWRAIAPAPSPAVTARLPSGRAASCWSGAGTAASPGAASARCVTAPPTTPPATAGSPSRPRRGRAGDVGRGRVDRITDAGLARQRPRRPDRRGHLRPRQAGMAPHRPEPDRPGPGAS